MCANNIHETASCRKESRKGYDHIAQEGNEIVSQKAVPPTILVIEDNSADVTLLRVALDRLNEEYVLQVLRDGDEALLFVEQHRDGRLGPDPCVIALDLHLPRHDGIEILHAIKQAPGLAHIHVVILTSLATPSEELDVISIGARFIQKPADLDGYIELAERLMEICRNVDSVMAN